MIFFSRGDMSYSRVEECEVTHLETLLLGMNGYTHSLRKIPLPLIKRGRILPPWKIKWKIKLKIKLKINSALEINCLQYNLRSYLLSNSIFTSWYPINYKVYIVFYRIRGNTRNSKISMDVNRRRVQSIFQVLFQWRGCHSLSILNLDGDKIGWKTLLYSRNYSIS